MVRPQYRLYTAHCTGGTQPRHTFSTFKCFFFYYLLSPFHWHLNISYLLGYLSWSSMTHPNARTLHHLHCGLVHQSRRAESLLCRYAFVTIPRHRAYITGSMYECGRNSVPSELLSASKATRSSSHSSNFGV